MDEMVISAKFDFVGEKSGSGRGKCCNFFNASGSLRKVKLNTFDLSKLEKLIPFHY